MAKAPATDLPDEKYIYVTVPHYETLVGLLSRAEIIRAALRTGSYLLTEEYFNDYILEVEELIGVTEKQATKKIAKMQDAESKPPPIVSRTRVA